MSCESNAEQLLLLAHGQLGAVEKVALVPHLWTCGACRERLRSFQATSRAFMAASALPVEVARRNRVVNVAGPLLSLRALFITILLAVSVGCALLGWQRVQSISPSPSPVTPVAHCAPGLHNDHCR